MIEDAINRFLCRFGWHCYVVDYEQRMSFCTDCGKLRAAASVGEARGEKN
jgi:hypothetical protein